MKDLSTIHHNKKIWICRIALNLLLSHLNTDDSIRELAGEIIKRALEIEKKTNKPCMQVPVRVYEVKKLFPENSPFLKHLTWGEIK